MTIRSVRNRNKLCFKNSKLLSLLERMANNYTSTWMLPDQPIVIHVRVWLKVPFFVRRYVGEALLLLVVIVETDTRVKSPTDLLTFLS